MAGVALAVRVLYLLEAADAPTFLTPVVDAGAYDLIARQLAAGGEAAARMFWQPFGYPAMLALTYLVTDGSIVAAKLLQAVLGAVTCGMVFVLADRRAGRTAAFVAASAVALYAPLVLFEGELLAAGPATFLGTLLLLLLDRADTDDPRPLWWWSLPGAVAALAVLMRPTFLPFVAAAAVWIAWRQWRRRGRGRAALAVAVAVAAFAACTLPVAAYSARVTGRFSFVPSSGGLNLYIGNNPDVCGTLAIRPGAAWGELVTLPERDGATTAAAKDRWYRDRVVDWALDEPLAFLHGLGRKALELVSSRELPRNLDPYLMRRWSAVLRILLSEVGAFGVPFGLLLPLAAVGLVLAGRRLGAPLLLYLALYSAAVVLVFVTARYRLPLIPPLAVAAGAGVAAVSDSIQDRRRGRLIAAVGVALAALLLATVPGPFCEERLDLHAELYATLGTSHSERGQPEQAIAAYRHALEIDPGRADVHYNLGRLLSDRGDLDGAEAEYRRTVELDPGFAPGHLNLGSVLMDQGRPEEAVEEFRQAAWSNPSLTLAQRNLATALLAVGRPDEALAAIEEARRLDPGRPGDLAMEGSALLQKGDAEGARAALTRALEQGADSPAVQLDLGTALLGLGDPQAALGHFERAAAMDPSLARARNNAGVALAMMGRMAEARARFAAAVEADPRSVDARINLARVLARQGDVEGARAQLESVLELDPDNRRARGMLAGLR